MKKLALMLCVLIVGGCASLDRATGTPPVEAHQTLSEGYALLFDLLNKNKDVGGIFMLKGGTDSFKAIIREIAQASRDGAAGVRRLAEDDPALSIAGANLPEIEARTRQAIEQTASRELLAAGGDDLQKRLVVEQLKAMRYASHLAATIAEQEIDESRASYLRELEASFSDLHDRLLAFLAAAHPTEST